jgi:serine/threonine protein kinase
VTDSGEFEADIYGLPVREGTDRHNGREPLETIVDRFLSDLRHGGQPDVEAYVRGAPHLADQLRELLPLAGAMERWKADQDLAPTRRSMPTQRRFEWLGNCRVRREIGRGGMGVVYEAEQHPSGRRVAVKVLPWRFPRSSLWREQFEQEARTASRLQHPHIVPVYEFGEQDGWCYYVMRLVEGVGLDRLIRLLREGDGSVSAEQVRRLFKGDNVVASLRDADPHSASRSGSRSRSDRTTLPELERIVRRNAWPQLVKIGIQVAQALRYAHQQGTLHRDIKPANLLVDSAGSVWVTDFGVAIHAGEWIKSPEPDVAGTLRYLAPEQWDGLVDVRSDVYSLGVTLYELLTLQPAFDAPDRSALIRQLREVAPPRPRAVNPAVPRDLERIVLKAMARDPDERHRSVDELMGELIAFNQRSAAERGTSLLWRMWKAIRGR